MQSVKFAPPSWVQPEHRISIEDPRLGMAYAYAAHCAHANLHRRPVLVQRVKLDPAVGEQHEPLNAALTPTPPPQTSTASSLRHSPRATKKLTPILIRRLTPSLARQCKQPSCHAP